MGREGEKKGEKKRKEREKTPSRSRRAGSSGRSVLTVLFGLSQPFPGISQSCERETPKAKGWEEEEDGGAGGRTTRGGNTWRKFWKGFGSSRLRGMRPSLRRGGRMLLSTAQAPVGRREPEGAPAVPCWAVPVLLSSASEPGYF